MCHLASFWKVLLSLYLVMTATGPLCTLIPLYRATFSNWLYLYRLALVNKACEVHSVVRSCWLIAERKTVIELLCLFCWQMFGFFLATDSVSEEKVVR